MDEASSLLLRHGRGTGPGLRSEGPGWRDVLLQSALLVRVGCSACDTSRFVSDEDDYELIEPDGGEVRFEGIVEVARWAAKKVLGMSRG